MRTIKALSQRPSPLRIELQGAHAAAGQFLLHRRDVRQARPIQPVAGDFDEKTPPSSFRRAVSRAAVCSGLLIARCCRPGVNS